MTQIKIITSNDIQHLQSQINKFILNHEMVNLIYNAPSYTSSLHTAIIVYKLNAQIMKG